MRLRFLFVIGLLVSTRLLGQNQEKLFSGDFKGYSFDRFVNKIESESNYQFYYDNRWTDTLQINFTANQLPLVSILEKIFKNTPLHFAVDPKQLIYITYEREMLTSLPDNFFGDEVAAPIGESGFDLSDYENEQGKIRTAEQKVYSIGSRSAGTQGNATIAGYVTNQANGEPVTGASVYIEKPLVGTTTDQFGFFSLTIAKGKQRLRVQSLDMRPTYRDLLLFEDGKLNIEVAEEVVSLKEVVVQSEREQRVSNMQMGVEKIDVKTLRQTPVAFGESDVLKVMLTMPGVQTIGEGASGINVRGGATSQNLILLNDAVVFNPSHLFGFFSTFNTDVLKTAELIKSGMTADYGGRLSSVLDVNLREGNRKKFTGQGGFSPITSRLTLEGPIIKDKLSFLIGARSTYSDWLLRQLDNRALQNSTGAFYDLNANISYSISEKDQLYITAYRSQDRFKLNNDTTFRFSDQNGSIKYKHIFNNRFYGVLTGSLSQYQFNQQADRNQVTAFQFKYKLSLMNLKADFNYFLNPGQQITFGVSNIHYDLQTGQLNPFGEKSLVLPEQTPSDTGNERAVYVGSNTEITRKWSVYAGLRYSLFNLTGPRDVYVYQPGIPRTTETITDTLSIPTGKTIARYGGPEPRLSIRYLISNNTSFKAGYNKTRQYIHMLSNTVSISPTDVWKLSDANIKPQIGDQISAGVYWNSNSRLIEVSLETYYKQMKDFLDFKNGAVMFLNPAIEADVVPTKGKAYGAEIMARKKAGKLNGWVSYTYARSFLRTTGTFSSENINRGNWYPANFDKPHSFNLIGNYRLNQRFSFSSNVAYSTGRPITIPLAKYEMAGSLRLAYSDRNQFRIKDYFRIDLGLNLEGSHRLRKPAHGSWSFSIYNLLGRSNAYSVYFVSKNGVIRGYQLSIFARPIPTVTYNYRF